MLNDLKKVTAVGIVWCGKYTIDKNIEDELIDDHANKKKEAEHKNRQKQEDW